MSRRHSAVKGDIWLSEEIDERVHAFLDRPIEGDWPYLWIVATYVKVRQNGADRLGRSAPRGRRQQRWPPRGAGHGHWPSEAELFWTAFLRTHARRDLRGVKLALPRV